MSRWKWLQEREKRLSSGSLNELLADIAYCRQREQLPELKSNVKAWKQRRAEAESAVIERFGEGALEAAFGASRAWGKQ